MATVEFASVSKSYPDGTVAVRSLDLTVADGELLILVGPSGCGKTTTLRMLAGFETVTAGTISIGGRVAQHLEPRDRGIAMVFQNFALYPHMTVERNIGFALKMRDRLPKQEIKRRVHEVAELLGLTEQLDKKPGQLSGGQRQRVAMGRAIVRQPDAFLMDEPLSSLDAKLRVRMRAELVRLHERLGVTTVYVTHDQTEAMTLGQRVAVMRDGILEQVASPQELYERPGNTFVADFIGSPSMNFLEGEIADGHLRVGAARFEVPDGLHASRGPVLVGIRPEYFHGADETVDDPRTLRGQVELVERVGPEVFAYARLDGCAAVNVGEQQVELEGACVARLDRRAAAALALGDRLSLTFDPADVQLFDPSTGVALATRPAPRADQMPA